MLKITKKKKRITENSLKESETKKIRRSGSLNLNICIQLSH